MVPIGFIKLGQNPVNIVRKHINDLISEFPQIQILFAFIPFRLCI
jgi:hypothetical protein